jgi:hypothetical protein
LWRALLRLRLRLRLRRALLRLRLRVRGGSALHVLSLFSFRPVNFSLRIEPQVFGST